MSCGEVRSPSRIISATSSSSPCMRRREAKAPGCNLNSAPDGTGIMRQSLIYGRATRSETQNGGWSCPNGTTAKSTKWSMRCGDIPASAVGRPARPGQSHPDQGLPGQGGHPGNRPPQGGRPSHPWAPPGQGHPDQGLPGGGSPDQELPELPPEVGIWPPPSASHPIVPVPPDHALPPGSIYPPLPDHARGKFLVLAWISGEHEKSGWHYVGDRHSDAKPDHSLPGGRPPHVSGQPVPGGGQPSKHRSGASGSTGN